MTLSPVRTSSVSRARRWTLRACRFRRSAACARRRNTSSCSRDNQKRRGSFRGVCKTVNGAHQCGCAPFLYAIMTYGTVAAAPLALPLGELSPKVTERVLQAFLNGDINLCAHAAKIHINISVGKTQNLQSKRCQECGTLRIIGHPLRLIVLRTIQFNN